MTSIVVENADVLTTQCDVLVLKYAQGFYGADGAVARALGLSDWDDSVLDSSVRSSTPASPQNLAGSALHSVFQPNTLATASTVIR